jgi:hypothetical protein
MEGANLIELVRMFSRSNFKYRCLVEALIDHETAPQDPLTSIILKGAQGIATDFWFYSGEWWRPALTVIWDNKYVGDSLTYIETYTRKGQIKEPITEIKFIRQLGQEEKKEIILPEVNPLIVRPTDKAVADYFMRVLSVGSN